MVSVYIRSTLKAAIQKEIKSPFSSVITLISLRLCFIFFLRLFFVLFFDCLPPSYFLYEDTRLELGDWGIWSIPLAGWGGLKKAAGEREETFPAPRWGRVGRRHSRSLPGVKWVLEWAKSLVSIICSYPSWLRVVDSTLRLWPGKCLHCINPNLHPKTNWQPDFVWTQTSH